jgi:hypothetical protein
VPPDDHPDVRRQRPGRPPGRAFSASGAAG